MHSQWHVCGDNASCQHLRSRGAQTHTCIYRCMWSCESHLLNDGLFGVGSGLGAGGCREVEVERRGRGVEVKTSWTSRNRLSLCLRLSDWVHVELGGKNGELCVCECVSVCAPHNQGVKPVPAFCSLKSQLWHNRLNGLVWNIELSSMTKVICFTNARADTHAWYESNMKLVMMNRTVCTSTNRIKHPLAWTVASIRC